MTKYLLILVSLCLSVLSFGQNKFHEIDEFVRIQMRDAHLPNVAIAIVTKDSVLFQKEYGADLEKANYLIGSISKSFTAIAVMQLYETGKLDIDRPVNYYLPWFEYSNKHLSDLITIRHLLNQTTGLPKSAGFFTPKSTAQNEIVADYKNYLRSLPIDESAIGQIHIYCNLNYQILGQIIMKASGMTYDEYVKKYIFIPIGMTKSSASVKEYEGLGLIPGYQYVFGLPLKRQFVFNNNGLAAGDISSNTTDMATFLQMLLNNGKTATSVILKESSLKQMQSPFSGRYGMGFSIGDWNGLHSVRHTGLSKNYGSAINILPKENHGIVILTNINSFYAVRHLMDGVIRRLHHQEKISYVPYELYFRYFLLAMVIWSSIDLILKIKKWKKHDYKMHTSGDFKVLMKLVISVSFAIAWLIVVPHYGNVPLWRMPALQPDLGYALIIGAFIGVCSALIQYFISSNALNFPSRHASHNSAP
ncbi:MAG: serine hydrolase domain-containing protein [Chryseolinea sp.]